MTSLDLWRPPVRRTDEAYGKMHAVTRQIGACTFKVGLRRGVILTWDRADPADSDFRIELTAAKARKVAAKLLAAARDLDRGSP